MTAAAANGPPPVPVVTDADIHVAEGYLGVSFDEPRRAILQSNESFDVQACPGSGKTTLLVAKLAILADKWPYSYQGICVLSHTNVARQEVENKLGETPVGPRLLAYPHFVGTIQSFVNEFLALPLLRSEGRRVRLIDDESHGERCRQLLYATPKYAKAKIYLEHKDRCNPDMTIRKLRYEGSDLTLGSAAGRMPCSPKSPSGTILAEIKKRVTESGIWRYDDMFAWAERLLAEHAEVARFARWRFPVVFVDEMQDTSELQGRLLNGVFPVSACGLRQRFGDSNQAIFDFGQEVATTDGFPSPDYRSLPNSQRFGPSIAAKTHSLAVVSPNPSLSGEGPRVDLLPRPVNSVPMLHTIFLFGTDSTRRVLPEFGSLLLQTFPDGVLQSDAFIARAIGRVGRSKAPERSVPRDLHDYWTAYEPQAAKPDPRPEHLAEYICLAQRGRVGIVDCAESIRTVAKGICELIEIARPGALPCCGPTTRWLLSEALRKDESSIASLRRLLWEWCIQTTPVVEQGWIDKTAELRLALGPIIGTQWNSAAEEFCRWSASSILEVQATGQKAKGGAASNCFCYRQGERFVDIEVGTIHGAKGQTHTATLVMETLFKKHDMEDLLLWICGEKCGARPKEGEERKERMRLLYTAMTRPSHLLCLAMRRDAIGQDGAEVGTRQQLEQLGWTVKDLDA